MSRSNRPFKDTQVFGWETEPRDERPSEFVPSTGYSALSGYYAMPDARGRIFEPYYSTRAGGTGLGLAIVASIAADHHAFVRHRENVPCGSRFVLEFPASSLAGSA